MVVTIPPEPVAPFGDVDLLPCLAHTVRDFHRPVYYAGGAIALCPHFSRPREQMLPCPVQCVPGRIVFLVPDPDAKIVVDPAPRKQMRQSSTGRMSLQIRPR